MERKMNEVETIIERAGAKLIDEFISLPKEELVILTDTIKRLNELGLGRVVPRDTEGDIIGGFVFSFIISVDVEGDMKTYTKSGYFDRIMEVFAEIYDNNYACQKTVAMFQGLRRASRESFNPVFIKTEVAHIVDYMRSRHTETEEELDEIIKADEELYGKEE